MGFAFPNSPTEGQTCIQANGIAYAYLSGTWQARANSVPEAPTDGLDYARKDGAWAAVTPVRQKTASPGNRLYNGTMQIAQDVGLATTMTIAAGGSGHVCDGWWTSNQLAVQIGLVAAQDASVAYRCLHANVAYGTAAPGTTGYVQIVQYVEGWRIADFGWGRPWARPAVLRFSMSSTKANAVVAVGLRCGPGATRSFIRTFTMSPIAGAFQDYVMPIQPDYAGTYPVDNTVGLQLQFVPTCGATGVLTSTQNAWIAGNFIGVNGMSNVSDTVHGNIQIGRVGLYVDPDWTGLAPPWEDRHDGLELRDSQRYYYRHIPQMKGMCYPSQPSVERIGVQHPVMMRTTPTCAGNMGGQLYIHNGTASQPWQSITVNCCSPWAAEMNIGVAAWPAATTAGGLCLFYQGQGAGINTSLNARM